MGPEEPIEATLIDEPPRRPLWLVLTIAAIVGLVVMVLFYVALWWLNALYVQELTEEIEKGLTP